MSTSCSSGRSVPGSGFRLGSRARRSTSIRANEPSGCSRHGPRTDMRSCSWTWPMGPYDGTIHSRGMDGAWSRSPRRERSVVKPASFGRNGSTRSERHRDSRRDARRDRGCKRRAGATTPLSLWTRLDRSPQVGAALTKVSAGEIREILDLMTSTSYAFGMTPCRKMRSHRWRTPLRRESCSLPPPARQLLGLS